MLKVQPSKKTDKEINKHKNLLEKVNLFSFALKYNDEIYVHVNYNKFGKTTGVLILTDEGEVVARQAALRPLVLFNLYNSFINDVIQVMIPETRKSTKPFEEALEGLKGVCGPQCPQYATRLMGTLEKLIQTRSEQEAHMYKIRDIQNVILDEKGYLTEEDVANIQEHAETFNRGQFLMARSQLDSLEDAEATISWLTGQRTTDPMADRLLRNLKNYSSNSTLTTLEKACKKQFSDYEGKEMTYPSGEEGAQKWIEVYRDILQQSVEKDIVPLLRN